MKYLVVTGVLSLVITFGCCGLEVNDGSGLGCFECAYFKLVAEPPTVLQDEANRLRRRSDNRCDRPEEDAPKLDCQSKYGHASRCMLLNGSVAASEAWGGLRFHAKIRRCVSLPGDSYYLHDGDRCYANPRLDDQLYSLVEDFFSDLFAINLNGGICFCDSDNCNAASKLGLGYGWVVWGLGVWLLGLR